MDRDRCRGPGPVPDPEPGTLRRRRLGGLGRGSAGASPRAAEGLKPVLKSPGGGTRWSPLGRAVGIKLFSDGVLVVGLSAVETDSGPSSPGRTCGLKAE